jgi:toxin YhaV
MSPKDSAKDPSQDSPKDPAQDRRTAERRKADRRTSADPEARKAVGAKAERHDASVRPVEPLVINGWTFLIAPHFALRWTNLVRAVIGLTATGTAATVGADRVGPEATMLRALIRVIRDHIARDPNDPAHRLKADLGAWRRVKFLGRFRLFFRFSSSPKPVVILTWLNDENTLRKEGASTDPYAVFSGMLRRGEVPDTWDGLLASTRPLPPPLPEVER